MKRPPTAALALLLGLALAGPALAQSRVVTAGQEGVPAPKRTRTVNPVYPQEAMAQGIRGIVILEVLIDTQGKVTSAEIIRSIPGLDEAALEAVRKWEYEVTKVGGQPVSVRLTVPITFAMKVPEVTRAQGIPELRQGAAVQYPAGETDNATVTAEVTLASDGQVAEAEVTKGNAPFSVSLLSALRTWRFAAEGEGVVLSFRVEADFAPPKGDRGRVEVRLTGLRRTEMAADQTAPAAPATPTGPPAEPAPSAPAPATPPPAAPATPPTTTPAPVAPAVPPPTPTTTLPAAPPPTTLPAAPPPTTAAPAPPATTPPTTRPAAPTPPPTTLPAAPPPTTAPARPTPAPVAPVAPPATTPPSASPTGPPAPAPARPGAPTDAEKKEATAPPPVEVLTVPKPPEAPAEPGVSAVKDVSLGPGVPDLVRGRRPVPPPLARMSGTTGDVEVKFGVDAAGVTSVQEANGPQVLTAAATYTVQSWFFRRISAERLHLVAVFEFAGETAKVAVRSE